MKPIIILLHGAWHASWCWKVIRPLLENDFEIIAPDLPGHGQNQQLHSEISLKTYIDFVSKLILQYDQPVTLMGHSMAGIIISQLAENFPEKIQQLIYLAAFIPGNGESLLHLAKKTRSEGLATEMLLDSTQQTIDLKRSQKLVTLFYNTCPEELSEFGLSHLQKEPSQPFVDPLILSNNVFGKIKKYYIECVQDAVLLVDDQRRIAKKNKCEIISMNCDHSPFFSEPMELVKIIKMICNTDVIPAKAGIQEKLP